MTLASSMTGIGHRLPRAFTTSEPEPAGVFAGAAGAPSFSRTAKTAAGSTDRNRSTSASGTPGGSDTRTLPSVRTPIAFRTWLGVSVLLVHEEPEETEKPFRSSSCSRVSPST